MTKRTGLLFLALWYLVIPISVANSRINDDSFDKETHRREYLAKVKKLGLPYDEGIYYKHKINLNKIPELAKAGVDVKKDFLNTKQTSVEGYALIAETVVKGTVIKLEYDTSRLAAYHSIYTVKVEKAYSGEAFKHIKVYQISGKFGNSFTSVSSEPEIKIGDKFLLFLVPFNYEEIAENKLKGNRFETFPPYHPENFQVINAFRLEGDKLYKSKYAKAENFKKKEANLKKVIKINDRKNFYSTRF